MARVIKHRRRDFQILWVVLIAAVCWGFVWQHEAVGIWLHRVWINRSRLF